MKCCSVDSEHMRAARVSWHEGRRGRRKGNLLGKVSATLLSGGCQRQRKFAVESHPKAGGVSRQMVDEANQSMDDVVVVMDSMTEEDVMLTTSLFLLKGWQRGLC